MKKSVGKFLTAGMMLASLYACSSDESSENSNPIGPEGDTPASSSAGLVDAPEGPTTTISSSSFAGSDVTVTVTEVMYNAPEGSTLEWIELSLVNGDKLLDMAMAELRLEGAVTFSFPAERLDKNEFIVVTNDPDLFKQTYPNFNGRLLGPWDNDPKTGEPIKLSNEGDVIEVKIKGEGDMSCAFSNEPPWPSLADGKGRTLVYVGGNPAYASSWGASAQIGGTPGEANTTYVSSPTIRINEVQPFVLNQSTSWIELYNYGKTDVDVTGWLLESKLGKKEWTIQSGIVPAGGFLVLDSTSFGESFLINPNGGKFYLYEMVNGVKTEVETSILLAASEHSSGVVDISDGSTAQGALASATPGAANTPLKSGPIYINEIYYNPGQKEGETFIPFEFLEIVNKGTEDVNLYVEKGGKFKGWKVEGINMEFEQNTIIPAGGMILLLSDSLKNKEAEVRATYGIDPAVQIAFYQGKLSNRGETIAIKQPFNYIPDEFIPSLVQWYYDWSDATLYSDDWAGYKDADGWGASLNRVNFETMGYEQSAWKVASPTIGK